MAATGANPADNVRACVPLARPDVLVVGSVNTDLVVAVPALPDAGETVLGDDLQRIGGGKGANQAVAAARLGARTALLACVGVDGLGDARLAELAAYGVDVSGVVTDPVRPTGAALILVDTAGENVIAVAPGANSALSPAHVAAAEASLAACRVLVCQLEVPAPTVQAALERARDNNTTTILNAAPGNPAADALLPSTDVLVVNRAEAASLVGHEVDSPAAARRAAAGLQKRTRQAAILTLGAEGSLLATPEAIEHFPAWQAPTVDATAAGDAFVGALAVELARDSALPSAARFATAAAAITVGRFGAQPALPSRAEVSAFLRHPPVAARTEACHDSTGGCV